MERGSNGCLGHIPTKPNILEIHTCGTWQSSPANTYRKKSWFLFRKQWFSLNSSSGSTCAHIIQQIRETGFNVCGGRVHTKPILLTIHTYGTFHNFTPCTYMEKMFPILNLMCFINCFYLFHMCIHSFANDGKGFWCVWRPHAHQTHYLKQTYMWGMAKFPSKHI